MADSKPIRWAVPRGAESYMGLAQYFLTHEENMRQSFSQPSRRARRTLPDGTCIDYIMNDVVDCIMISIPRKLIEGAGIEMVWNKEPPYSVDGNDQPIVDDEGKRTWVIDLLSEEMMEDENVEGGYYFIVTVINGTNADGKTLPATFFIKAGEDESGEGYTGWSVEQGDRQDDGSYNVDGRSATILLGDDVEGDAVIVANDLETTLVRKIVLDGWQILYVPDPGHSSGRYVIANKSTLEPSQKLFLRTEAEYWPGMGLQADLFYVGSATNQRGGTVSYGESYQNDIWSVRDYTGSYSGTQTTTYEWRVASSSSPDATVYWEDTTETVYSWTTEVIFRKAWLTGTEEPEGPTEWNGTLGSEYYNCWRSVSSSGSQSSLITYEAFNLYEYSWVKDATHNGFFLRKKEIDGTSASVTDCFVHNRQAIPLATGTYASGAGYTGNFVEGIKVTCYKAEDLLSGGTPESEDVLIVSYRIADGWNDATEEIVNQIQTGYLAVIKGGAIIKTFSSTTAGVHELIEKEGIQLYSKGWFYVHKTSGE